MNKGFVVGFAVIGVVLLYLASVMSQPENIGLNDVEGCDGKNVTVKGVVVEKYQTKNGNTIMDVSDNNISIPVFLKGKTDAEIGDEIRVTGKIQKYKDEYEIVASEIEILKRWNEESLNLSQLKSNPEKYEGMNINVTGFVTSIRHNKFNLSDDQNTTNCSIKVVIMKSTTELTELAELLLKNQKIFVKGKFVKGKTEQDENGFEYRFEYFIELDRYGVFNE